MCLILGGLAFFCLIYYRAEAPFSWTWAAAPESSGQPQPLAWGQLERWLWPAVWVAGLLMFWGLCRSLTRGCQELKRRRPPTAWLLTLYAAAELLGATVLGTGRVQPTAMLPLASLAVVLAVFGVADFFRGISERLILLPPAERQEEVAV